MFPAILLSILSGAPALAADTKQNTRHVVRLAQAGTVGSAIQGDMVAATKHAHTHVAGKPPKSAFIYDNKKLIYSDENAQGYRKITSTEPGAGDDVPLSKITFYPQSNAPDTVEFSFSTHEGPEIRGSEQTLMVHTNIPFAP